MCTNVTARCTSAMVANPRKHDPHVLLQQRVSNTLPVPVSILNICAQEPNGNRSSISTSLEGFILHRSSSATMNQQRGDCCRFSLRGCSSEMHTTPCSCAVRCRVSQTHGASLSLQGPWWMGRIGATSQTPSFRRRPCSQGHAFCRRPYPPAERKNVYVLESFLHQIFKPWETTYMTMMNFANRHW
jgi:hypothetical protein